MFNKDEIVNFINDLGVTGIIVFAGASLVLHGLKETTQDIDCYIEGEENTKMFFDKYKHELVSTNWERGLYLFRGVMEISFVNGVTPQNDQVVIDGISSWTLVENLNFYKSINRDKDQVTIVAIEMAIKQGLSEK